MLTEIVTDDQLIKLYNEGGYLIAVDYTKQEIKLHTVDCMLADPISSVGVKPHKGKRSKKLVSTGIQKNAKKSPKKQKKSPNKKVTPSWIVQSVTVKPFGLQVLS